MVIMMCIFHFFVVKFAFYYLEAEQKDRSYLVSSYILIML